MADDDFDGQRVYRNLDDEELAPPDACGGLLGRCPDCIALYRAHAGSIVALCMICDGRHWAYEDHVTGGPDADG